MCIRLATYENAKEAKFLESIFVGRSGQLENTVFAILDPKGSKNLIPPSRGPRGYGSARALSSEMNRIASEYPGRAERDVPKNHSLRLALNIAACDSRPLVVTYGPQRKSYEATLRTLVWNDKIKGRAIYSQSLTTRDAVLLRGLPDSSGIVVVKPDKFGAHGQVIGRLSDRPSIQELSRLLTRAQPPSGKHTREHIAQGRRAKVHWKTAVPVTDPAGKY